MADSFSDTMYGLTYNIIDFLVSKYPHATLESADCGDDAKLENIPSVSAILTQN